MRVSHRGSGSRSNSGNGSALCGGLSERDGGICRLFPSPGAAGYRPARLQRISLVRPDRKVSRVPIIFISSASDNMNIVMAMNMGADDFIAKPFDMAVLTAKIQALLRRSYDFRPFHACPGAPGRHAEHGRPGADLPGSENRADQNEYRILLTLMETEGR